MIYKHKYSFSLCKSFSEQIISESADDITWMWQHGALRYQIQKWRRYGELGCRGPAPDLSSVRPEDPNSGARESPATRRDGLQGP